MTILMKMLSDIKSNFLSTWGRTPCFRAD